MFTILPVVKDEGEVVTLLTVLAVGVVNVVGVLLLSVTRTHTHSHYSSCCYGVKIIQIKMLT